MKMDSTGLRGNRWLNRVRYMVLELNNTRLHATKKKVSGYMASWRWTVLGYVVTDD